METSQNSLTLYLCAYAEAMFNDIKPAYTGLRDWERDKTRLLHEIREHGSHIMTIHLPAVGKSLDKALDLGLYQPRGGYLEKSRQGEQVPVFLRNLFIQVFDLDGMLRSTPNLAVIAEMRQLLLGGKKLLLPCSDRREYAEVVDFRKTEQEIRRPTLHWDLDDPYDGRHRPVGPDDLRMSFTDLFDSSRNDVHQAQSFWDFGDHVGPRCSYNELSLTQRVCDYVVSGWGDFHEEESSAITKHGPGAVSDLRRGMSKYQFQDWPSKLEAIFPFDAYAVHDFMCSTSVESVVPGRNREVPSKLISVPKTQKSPRLIASEPSMYQWCQQLVRHQLEARSMSSNSLIRHSITFGDQRPNQELAISGSIDGKLVTIDLSSASDRLSCWAIERFSRSNPTLLDRLHAVRTRWVQNGIISTNWRFLQLRKYSTMGSAVIFPLQTVFYACLATAAVLLTDKPRTLSSSSIEDASRQVRVFGDDIIVPEFAFRCMVRLLQDMGLKVNESKTFWGGNFRESCGTDAFRGVDVTPTYLRRAPDSAQVQQIDSFLEVSNNFWKKGWWHVAEMLRSYTTRWEHLIPIVGPACTQPGHFSFCGTETNHLKRRWNSDLHQYEYRVATFSKSSRRIRGTARQDLMQWFIEKPRADLPWEAGTDQAVVSVMRPGWRASDHYGQ